MTARANPQTFLQKPILTQSIITFLAIVPLIGVISPRAMAYVPAVIALFGYIALSFQTRQWTPFNLKVSFGVIAVSGLILLSTIWAMDVDITLSRFSKAAPIFLGMVLMVTWIPNLQTNDWKAFTKIFRVILIIAGLYILFEFLTDGLITRATHETDRFGGLSFMNRCITVYFFCALPIFCASKLERFDYALAALLTLIIFFSDSQSIQLALVLFVSVRWILPFGSKFIWIAMTTIIASLFLAAPFIAIYLFNTLPEHLETIEWFANAYASDRLEIWDFIARRALEKPWFGHGIEATRLIKDFDVQNMYFPDSTVLHPHNFALQVWIEFGLLGAILITGLFTFIMYEIRKTFLKNELNGRFCIAVFITSLSVAASTYGIWQGWWLGLFCYIMGTSVFVATQQRIHP